MAILEVEHICKSFKKNEVLKDISFSLEESNVLSIIGSSGSGKTTLLRCLNFLETPDSGVMKVKDKIIYDRFDPILTKDRIIRQNRLHFGLVFQQFNLFPQYTVLGNLTLAAILEAKKDKKNYKANKDVILGEINARALSLLEKVGLENKKDSYPCELSGGQQQRVAIARALMLSPDILCFDEPTSALDPELTKEVLKVIRDLKVSKNTMIVVTHEMEFAKNVSDKVMFMADGIIEEFGDSKEVFENPKSPKLKAFLDNSFTI